VLLGWGHFQFHKCKAHTLLFLAFVLHTFNLRGSKFRLIMLVFAWSWLWKLYINHNSSVYAINKKNTFICCYTYYKRSDKILLILKLSTRHIVCYCTIWILLFFWHTVTQSSLLCPTLAGSPLVP
jgi:hypothetical protein